MKANAIPVTGKKAILSCFFLLFLLSGTPGISQNMLFPRDEILNHKISEIIATDNMVLDRKSKPQYIDTMIFDSYGNLSEKRITAYDTASESKYAGDWTYTYDSLNNRLLETRKFPHDNIMDYFVYVYDSASRIQKQIWIYWVNLRLAFSKIYKVQYDSSGRMILEKVEDGTQKLDSAFSFKYDEKNRLLQTTCSSDKNFKDTINTVKYYYNTDGTLARTVSTGKPFNPVVEFAYDTDKRLIQKKSGDKTTVYQYNENGLPDISEVTLKGKPVRVGRIEKTPEYKYSYTYSYIYK